MLSGDRRLRPCTGRVGVPVSAISQAVDKPNGGRGEQDRPNATASNAHSADLVGVVVKGYPRLSETFIAQELRGLEARGVHLQIISLRQPYDPTTHPIHGEIAAAISYLPEYLWRAPIRQRSLRERQP